MKTTLCSAAAAIALAAAAMAATAAREEVTRTLDRTIATSAGQTLVLIHSSSGDTRIRVHSRPEIRIVATIRVSAESRDVANEFIQSVTIDAVDTPSRLTIETRHAVMSRRYRNLGFAVDLDVFVPERMPLEASQRFGSLTASGLGADATLKNTNGRLSATDVRGRLRLENRFGPIEASRVTGTVTIVSSNGAITASTISGSVDATNSFGAVTLRDIGQSVRVENSNGAINVQDVRGGAVLATRFGPVDAQLVRGGLRVDNSNGHIRAADVDGETLLHTKFGQIVASRVRGAVTTTNSNGSIRVVGTTGALSASTRFGSVSVREVDGPLDIQTANGNVDAALAPRSAACHRVAVNSQFGAITVYPGGAGYDVSAATRFGTIQTDLPFATTGILQPQGRESKVTGTIGGGGCVLQLIGNNGNILIRGGGAPDVSVDVQDQRGPRIIQIPQAPQAPRAPRAPRTDRP